MARRNPSDPIELLVVVGLLVAGALLLGRSRVQASGGWQVVGGRWVYTPVSPADPYRGGADGVGEVDPGGGNVAV